MMDRFSKYACSAGMAGIFILLMVACSRVPTGDGIVRPQGLGSWRVSASLDDGHSFGGTLVSNGAQVVIGQAGGVDRTAGFRFVSVDIPQGSSITTATLDVVAFGSWTAATSWIIAGEAADSCSNFATSFPASRTLTTASVIWAPGSWVSGTAYTSPDIAGVVEEITTRSGWTGAALCLIVRDNQSTDLSRQAWAYDGNPSWAARLNVSYTPPPPTPTPIQTPTPTATPVCGAIHTPTTWSGLVRVGCPVGVSHGVTLTIASGTRVEVLGPYAIDILGGLDARGLPTNPITFTAGVSSAVGQWGPLRVDSPAVQLDYVVVSTGRALEVAAPVTISHAMLLSNVIGIDMIAPAALVSSTVQGNGMGVLVRGEIAPTLQGVNLTGNSLSLLNSQALTLTVPGIWWGSTVSVTIAAGIWDADDDVRLGPVLWEPAASGPFVW